MRATGVESGTVTLRDGSRALGSAPVADGVARIALAARSLKPGTHALSASYAGSGTVSGSSTTVRVTVAKVATGTVLKAQKAGPGKARVTVTVTAPGVTPSGRVTVRVGSKTRAVTLRGGTATLVLSGAGTGRVKVSASYGGDDLARGSSATTTVVLKKR